MCAAAVTLGNSGSVNIQTAEQAANALEPLAGSVAKIIFAVGIVGLGLFAVPVLAGATAYAVAEALHWHEGLSRRLKDAPRFYGVIIASYTSPPSSTSHRAAAHPVDHHPHTITGSPRSVPLGLDVPDRHLHRRHRNDRLPNHRPPQGISVSST
jgi:Natural resistance-associated macrophage protein